MDRWEETQREIRSLSHEEREKFVANAMSMCVCGECPTYNDCTRDKMQLLFCDLEKSNCAMEMTGCICPTCQVAKDQGLKKAYYCVRGNEAAQRGRQPSSP